VAIRRFVDVVGGKRGWIPPLIASNEPQRRKYLRESDGYFLR